MLAIGVLAVSLFCRLTPRRSTPALHGPADLHGPHVRCDRRSIDRRTGRPGSRHHWGDLLEAGHGRSHRTPRPAGVVLTLLIDVTARKR